MHKLRVGVLMGGKSSEHEVSFNSGRTVCDHLDASRYEIIPVFQTRLGQLYLLPWRFLCRGKTSDFTHRLPTEATHISWDDLKQLIDFAFIAMHGQHAEDGILQGMLEILQIPYLGSKVLASALGMNKIMQKSILRAAGIKTPRGINLQPHAIRLLQDNQHALDNLYTELIEKHISFPVVVKPACEGSSLGVSIVHTQINLLAAIVRASTASNTSRPVIIEEKLTGMEFSCVCLTDYTTDTLFALTPTEIVPESSSGLFCYAQKYMPGRATKFTPARCSPADLEHIKQTCIATSQALGMSNITRIDGFLTESKDIVIVDPNSLSGMGPSSFLFREAAESGMNHTHVINHLIETELHAYGIPQTIQLPKENSTVKKDTMRIAVILGGRSNEREISLESGRNIVYKLSPTKYAVLPLFLSEQLELFKLSHNQLIRNSTHEIAHLLDPADHIAWHTLAELVDFVFIALHGGEGENGCIQGALEMLELPYNGSSVLTSALCIDKYKTNRFLHAQGFQTPKGHLLERTQFFANREHALKNITAEIPFPLIIKPHNDGCSFMVLKATTAHELDSALEQLFTHAISHALIEECITGMELTVGCIGNENPKALPPSKAVSASSILSLEEKFLPGAGENITPAPLPPEALRCVQHEIERIYTALNCKGYARIDCFYQDATVSPTGHERIVCIEVNTLPGMTPATVLFHQAAEIGIKPSELIDHIIAMGIDLHNKNSQLASPTSRHKLIDN